MLRAVKLFTLALAVVSVAVAIMSARRPETAQLRVAEAGEMPTGGDVEKLLGRWRVTAFREAGRDLPEGEFRALADEFEFAGNTVTIRRVGKQEFWGPFEADSTARPPQFRMLIMIPDVCATYELTGDTLRLCYYTERSRREVFPRSLISRAQPSSDLVTLQRAD